MGVIISVISQWLHLPLLDYEASAWSRQERWECLQPLLSLSSSALPPHPTLRQLFTLCAFLSGPPNWPNLRNVKKLAH